MREGAAEGPLVGGSLEAIWCHLKGSEAWVDPAGAILFLETSELAYPPSVYDSALTDLENLGVFDAAAGLVFAPPYGYDEEAKELLWRVLRERTEPAGIPVLADVDMGHADPMITLPLGCPARLDAGAPSFELLEPATAG